jgi:cell division protein FtsL
MTNSQLYFAIGVPCFTILAALIVNILTVLGVRGDIREIRADIREIRTDMSALRSEMHTKMDLLLAKFYEHDTDIAQLKNKTGL